MKTISFTIDINAPINKVWDALWNDDNYRKWTNNFYLGSFYESDWEVGGKTLFLGPNRDGMFATITKLEKPYEVVFNHLGEIVNGVESVKYDNGSFEKYQLKEIDGITRLVISLDTLDEYEQDMNEGFSKGIEDIKRISENS
jgi:uncharacterized protein YndB with AHSA1/START domain